MRSGHVFRQVLWAPVIGVIGGGALPTPVACVANDGERPAPWLTRRERMKAELGNGNGMGMPLSIAVQLLPTPCASNAKEVGPKGSASQIHNEQNGNLCGVIKGLPSVPTGAPMYLNPSFVEEMMGFPIGWTDCEHLGTQLSLRLP